VEGRWFYPLGLIEKIKDIEERIYLAVLVPESYGNIWDTNYRERFIKANLKVVMDYYNGIPHDKNPYQYVLNNPVKDYDPDAEIPQEIIGGAIAGCFLGSALEGAITACEKPCASPGEVLKEMAKGCGSGALWGAVWGTKTLAGMGTAGPAWGKRVWMLYKCLRKIF
jgi:hypothetical protein